MPFNTVTISGVIGKDAEVRYFGGGEKGVATISVAVTERWLDAQQQQQERTSWFECAKVGTEKFLQYALANFVKGQKIFLQGKLVQKKWQTSEGSPREKVIIEFSDFELDGNRKGQRTAEPAPAPAARASQQRPPQKAASDRVPEVASAYNDAEDIPF